MKTAFLILGAQRSGTSVASPMLSKLGVNFGDAKKFLQDQHNPISFELDWVNDCNNQIINALGYKYTDFFLPVEKNYEKADTAAIEAQIQTLIKDEWQNSPVIGIKDPRFGLTFPVWEKVLLENKYKLNIILAFRNPSSFLESHKKLLQNWNNEKHLNYWFQINLSAVYFTRNHPVYYISYDRIMDNPVKEANKLALTFNLDLKLARQAAQVVKQSYYHHKDVAKTNNHFVDNCYSFLCAQAVSTADDLSYSDLATLYL